MPHMMEYMFEQTPPDECPQTLLASMGQLNVAALANVYKGLRTHRPAHMDGADHKDFGADPTQHLTLLHQRLQSGAWLAQLISEEGGSHLISLEGWLVQEALAEVLRGAYKGQFFPCRFEAKVSLAKFFSEEASKGWMVWLLDMNLEQFWTHLDHGLLTNVLLTGRIDARLVGLVEGCLHVGLLRRHQQALSQSARRAHVQGWGLARILADIYLHHGIDVWFEHCIKPCLEQRVVMVRHQDNALFGFESLTEASNVIEQFPARLNDYALALDEKATRLHNVVGLHSRGASG